jgi:hypothetical protein
LAHSSKSEGGYEDQPFKPRPTKAITIIAAPATSVTARFEAPLIGQRHMMKFPNDSIT